MGRLRSLPHRELKEIAKRHRIPATGTVEELRDRLEHALSAGVKDSLAGSFLQTKQAFSYRYYRLKKSSSTVEEVVKQVSRSNANEDPFRTVLRPSLDAEPKVYSARATPDALFLHLAFSGDERTVQHRWEEIVVVPPILCVVAIRESESILELRGRWEKVTVVEEWLKERLALQVEHLSFDWKLLRNLKQILKAKLATQTIRPNAGGIGTIRISASTKDVDLEDNESGEEVRKVFSTVGYQPGNPGFVFHPTEIRVRANDKQGSFYIPKHAREEEVTTLRRAFLVAHGLVKRQDFVLPEAPASNEHGKTKTRLLTPSVLQERLENLSGFTVAERRTVANVIGRLQRHQQERMLPAIWELWLPQRDGSEVMKALVRARVLHRGEEAQCSNCDFIGTVDSFPADCPECQSEIANPVVFFALRGFLVPQSADDQVFHPDYRQLAHRYATLLDTRVAAARATNTQKKAALEDLAECLFEALDGMKCVGRNVLTANHEVDRVFRNRNQSHPLLSKMGGNLRLECKNTAVKVTSAELGTFVDVLRDCKSPFGVYASMQGFTGMPDDGRKPKKLSDALLTARDARRDGIKVLMLTDSHLKAVCQEGRSLVDVLWRAFEYVESL